MDQGRASEREAEMKNQDQILDLFARLSVIGASVIYATPFLLIAAWLTGVR